MKVPLQQAAPGLTRVGLGSFCCYLLSEGEQKRWVLVDSGPPGSTQKVIQAAAELFGKESRPECILLTHGHFDHAGSAAELADFWGVPAYAHQTELHFLSGKAEYPPADPTVGGFFSLVVRFLPEPNPTPKLGQRVHPLPDDGTVPGLPEWRWHASPGHTPGHVCYFRASDRTLLAGDCLALVNFNSFWGVVTDKQELSSPAPPITSDWPTAIESIRTIAKLMPLTVAPGHGKPISGEDLPQQLGVFALQVKAPAKGRYARQPAQLESTGAMQLPSAPPDPFNQRMLQVFAVLLAASLATSLRGRTHSFHTPGELR